MDFDQCVSTQAFQYDNAEQVSTQSDNAAQDVNNQKVQVGELKTTDKTFPIYKGVNIIGRDETQCDIVLNSLTVSKKHAEIEANGKTDVFISDSGSSNGTMLNSTLLKKNKMYQISDQNEIHFGNILAKFVLLKEKEEGSSENSNENQKDVEETDSPKLLIEEKKIVSRASAPSNLISLANSKNIETLIENSSEDIFDAATQQPLAPNVENQSTIAEETIFDMETQNVAGDNQKKESDTVVEDSAIETTTGNVNPSVDRSTSIIDETIFDVETQKIPDEHSETLVGSGIFDAATQNFVPKSTKKSVAHSTPLRDDHKFAVPKNPPIRSLNISAIETSLKTSQVEKKLEQSEDIFNAETQQVSNQESSIFDAPTQCLSATAETSVSNDSDTDEEGYFETSSERSGTNVTTESLTSFDDDLSVFEAPTQTFKKPQLPVPDESSVNDSSIVNIHEAVTLKLEETTTTDVDDEEETSNESICLLETESAKEFLAKNVDVNEKSDVDSVSEKEVTAERSEQQPSDVDIHDEVTQKPNVSTEDDSDTDDEATFLDKNNVPEETTEAVDDDIFEMPTQKVSAVMKPEMDTNIFEVSTQMVCGKPSLEKDDIFEAPTQMITKEKEKEEIEANIFEAPTQMITKEKEKPEIEANIFDAPTQMVHEKPNFEKEDIFEAPTQVILKKKPEVEANIFDAPTQMVTAENPEIDTTIFDAPTQVCEKLNLEKDDIFEALTQVIPKKIDVKPHLEEEDIFEAPTQVLSPVAVPEPETEASIFDAPTQIVAENPSVYKDDIFEAPTRVISVAPVVVDRKIDVSIFEAPTQNNGDKPSLDKEDIFEAPTQLISEPAAVSTSVNDAPIQKVDVKIVQPTADLSDSDTDEEGFFESKSNETTIVSEPTKEPAKDPSFFDALTQKTVVQQEDSETDEEGEFCTAPSDDKKDVTQQEDSKTDEEGELTTSSSVRVTSEGADCQDEDIFDAPTQVTRKIDFEQRDSDSDADMAATQKVEIKPQQSGDEEKPEEKSEEDLEKSEKQQSDDDDYLPATQKVTNSTIEMDSSDISLNTKNQQIKIVVRSPTDEEELYSDSELDATQKVEKVKEPTPEKEKADSDSDSELDATQKVEKIEEPTPEKEKADSDSDSELPATQKVEKIEEPTSENEKADSDSDTELAATQKVEIHQQSDKKDESDDEQNLPATQKVNTTTFSDSSEDVFEQSVKVIEEQTSKQQSESDSDIEIAATQKMENRNSTIFLDTSDDLTSSGPIEEKLRKMVGESLGIDEASPMMTQQLKDILEPTQEVPVEEAPQEKEFAEPAEQDIPAGLESSPIVRSRKRIEKTPKKSNFLTQTVEENLEGLLGEPQQEIPQTSSPMMTQQIADMLQSQPSTSTEVVSAPKKRGRKRKNPEDNEDSKVKQARTEAPVIPIIESHINLRPRRKRNFAELLDDDDWEPKRNGMSETKKSRKRKSKAETTPGESSGTLRLSLTERNDVWESKSPDGVSVQTPGSSSGADSVQKRKRGRPRGSKNKVKK